jgi:molybdopterin/thiamine biosynthesis adenylyltransferase
MNYKLLETCKFIGKDGLETLQSKTVSIVGLGGVGSTVAQILVRNGIKVRVVDKGRVDEKDVPRQTLFMEEDVTKFKAKQVNKYALEQKIPLIYMNNAAEKGHMLIVDRKQYKKCPCVACIEDKLEIPTFKEAGAYSPITSLIAGLIVNAVMKNLLNIPNEDSLLNIDVLKTEIRHSSVEKDRKCSECKGL